MTHKCNFTNRIVLIFLFFFFYETAGFFGGKKWEQSMIKLRKPITEALNL